MTQIWEHLFVGSLADAQRLLRKNSNRIATVISLCEQCVEGNATDIHYIHLPLEDYEPVPVRQFDAVMQAIAMSIRKQLRRIIDPSNVVFENLASATLALNTV
jgi:hypothetical protein